MKKKKYYNPNNFNAVHSAVAYLLFTGFSFLASVALFFFIKWRKRQGPITDLAPYLCLEAALVGAALLLSVWLISLFCKTNPVKGGGYLCRKGLGTEALMAAVGACGLAALLAPMAESVAENFYTARYIFGIGTVGATTPELQSTGWILLYSFVLVPLIPAVFEELLFRGVIMRGFEQFGKTAAVVLSSVLFSLAHGNTDQMVYQFLFGLFLGFLAMETRSIFVAMSAHFANNLFAVVSVLPVAVLEEKHLGQGFAALASVLIVFIGVVCLTAAVLYFGKRMFHSKKKGALQDAGRFAVYIERDEVVGSIERIQPWYETGKLQEKNDEPVFFTMGGRSRVRLNRKSGNACSVVWIGICTVLSIAKIILAFFGV